MGFAVGAVNAISEKESAVKISSQIHPLDPLSAEEFRVAAALLASAEGVSFPAWRLAAIELIEPDKASADAFESDTDAPAPDRLVRCLGPCPIGGKPLRRAGQRLPLRH